MIDNFNIGFINSTFVFSAWIDDKLVGCVRVLSDLHFRSVIYDLAVLPEFQNKWIGKELVQKCRNACENSEWLVQTVNVLINYKFNLLSKYIEVLYCLSPKFEVGALWILYFYLCFVCVGYSDIFNY